MLLPGIPSAQIAFVNMAVAPSSGFEWNSHMKSGIREGKQADGSFEG